MNLHEYQGKDLLASFGVRIQRGLVASNTGQAIQQARKLQLETNTNFWLLKLRYMLVEEARVEV